MPSYFERYVLAGGVMMIFLVLCSLLAVGYVVQGFVRLRRKRLIPPELTQKIYQLSTPGELNELRESCEKKESLLGTIILRLLPQLHSPVEPEYLRGVVEEEAAGLKEEERGLLERVMRRLVGRMEAPIDADYLRVVIQEEVRELFQRNAQLSIIYTVAPLLGLLGTVLGMMKAFYEFSLSEVRSVAQLSQGINEALVTTMWGLLIAIPAFVFLQFFRYRLLKYESLDLLRLLELLSEKVSQLPGAGEEESDEDTA